MGLAELVLRRAPFICDAFLNRVRRPWGKRGAGDRSRKQHRQGFDTLPTTVSEWWRKELLELAIERC
jgi:hypothetical protein